MLSHASNGNKSNYRVTSVEFAEDSSLVSCGFGDSNLRIWTLTPNKLRAVKQLEDLEIIDKEAGKSQLGTAVVMGCQPT